MWRGEARRSKAERRWQDTMAGWAIQGGEGGGGGGSNSLGRTRGWLVGACKRPDGRCYGESSQTVSLSLCLFFRARSLPPCISRLVRLLSASGGTRTRHDSPFTIDTIVAAGWPSPLRRRSLVSSTDSICLPRGCLITGPESGPWSRPSERASEQADNNLQGDRWKGDERCGRFAETRARARWRRGERAKTEKRNIRRIRDTPSASPFIVVLVPVAVPLPLRH